MPGRAADHAAQLRADAAAAEQAYVAGTQPGTAPAGPPATPPAAPPPAAQPPAEPAPPAPAATAPVADNHPPATPPPAASPPAEPQPPPPAPDYKALYEGELTRKQSQSKAYVDMRGYWQTELQKRTQLEAALAQYQGRAPAVPGPAPAASGYGGPGFDTPGWKPPPAPQVPAGPPANGNGAQAPAPPAPQHPGVTPEILATARKAIIEELGEKAAESSEVLIRAVAGEIANSAAAEAARSVATSFQQQYTPFLQDVGGLLSEQQRYLAAQQNDRFNQEMEAEGHGDWETVLASQDFTSFVQGHNHHMLWWPALYPEGKNVSGTPKEHAYILDEYKKTRPEFVAEQAHLQENRQREAAVAASSHGDIHTMTPGAPAQEELMYMSQVRAESQKLAGSPVELRKFLDRINAAAAAGRLIDDTAGPMLGQTPVMP